MIGVKILESSDPSQLGWLSRQSEIWAEPSSNWNSVSRCAQRRSSRERCARSDAPYRQPHSNGGTSKKCSKPTPVHPQFALATVRTWRLFKAPEIPTLAFANQLAFAPMPRALTRHISDPDQQEHSSNQRRTQNTFDNDTHSPVFMAFIHLSGGVCLSVLLRVFALFRNRNIGKWL